MLLRQRSILLESLLLVVLIGSSKCQTYDYGVEEGDDHQDFTDDESGHPDYSKYYSVDHSAPISVPPGGSGQNINGFVTPIEFSSFFAPSSPIDFGESKNREVKSGNGFVKPPVAKDSSPFGSIKSEFPEFYASDSFPTKDYFEETRQDSEEDKSSPGPSYISHKVQPKYYSEKYKNHPNKHQVETIDVEKYNKKSKSPKKYKPEYTLDDPAYYDKYTNYNSGKSGSSVSQYPSAKGLKVKPTLSPYQKYSFQPTEDYGFQESSLSTVTPFNPSYNKVVKSQDPIFEEQPSENIPSNLKGCKRITKPVTEAEAMNCFVCEDAQTKSKYTQCSYTSEPTEINQYQGKSERYSTPGRDGDGFRYKRYSDSSEEDPYTYIKEQSQRAYQEPKESEKYYEDYHYSPDYYVEETQPEKSYSERQSEEIRKNPKNCKKIEKEGMTCTICKDAASGGNFEQCSYTSEPQEKKYAYVTEKKYDSEQPEESNPIVDKKEVVPQKKSKKFGAKLKNKKSYEPIELYEERSRSNKRSERQNKRRRNEEGRGYDIVDVPKSKTTKKLRKSNNKKASSDDKYDIPSDYAESVVVKNKKPDREPYDSEEVVSTTDKNQFDINEYHFKLFPEFSNEESKQEAYHVESPISDEHSSSQDVEEVLAEFTKKDRSNCKKSEKKGMTCYLCVDQNKIQQEECMYVSESQPKSTRVAYHGVQQLGEEPKKEVLAAKPQDLVLETAASEEIDTVQSFQPKKKPTHKKKRKSQSSKSKKNHEPTIKTPVEFEVNDEEGAFSAETRPVYSRQLGVQLPRYMLDKSEFEKEFDAFAGSH